MSVDQAVAGAKRADAVRNIERALEAAIICLSRQPKATMAEIAKEAGIGRVTLYGHFSSRAELLDAVVARVINRGEERLAGIDLEGDPREALGRVIASSWRLVEQSQSVIEAAAEELSPERIRQLHDSPAARVEALIERGRDQGVFRTDMPTSWQIAMVHQVLHGAAAELAAGRLDAEAAPDLINQTVFTVLDATS